MGAATSFNFAKTAFDQEVLVVAPASDGSGDVYVGGTFTFYGGQRANRIARLEADSAVDRNFETGTGFDSRVTAIVPAEDGTGAIYVGGEFQNYNGVPVSRIVKLRANGVIDTSFSVGTGFDFTVRTIALAADGSGDLYVGGQFSRYQGMSVRGLVRLNATGSIDAGFDVGAGFNSLVTVVLPAGDGSGDVYAGGFFTSYDGVAANRIVALNANGSLDAGFNVGNGFNGAVLALALDGLGDVYAGGSFTAFDGQAVNRIARIDLNGTLDAGFVIGTGFSGISVQALALANDGSGDLYVSGAFSSFNGTPASNVVRLKMSGAIEAGFSFGSGFDFAPVALAVKPDGSGGLLAAGGFGSYNGVAASRLVALEPDGSVDASFKVFGSAGFSLDVHSVARARDGSGILCAGGAFRFFDGVPSSRVAALDANGRALPGFASGSGFNGEVQAVASSPAPTGRFYLGGDFTSYMGMPARRLVALNSDGTLDAAFGVGPGLGFNSGVRSLLSAVDGSGDLYAGGTFTSYNGTPVNRIVAINPNGTIDGAFNVGTGFNGPVNAMALAQDPTGDLFVGGDFTAFDTTMANRIVRLSSNGMPLAGFISGSGFNNVVEALAPAIDGSGAVYVGGQFTSFDGTAVNRLVRLRANGSLDPTFEVGIGFDFTVLALLVATDGSGDLYVGGAFSSYDGAEARGLIRLNKDGSPDTNFVVGAGFNDRVLDLLHVRDGSGDILAAGGFETYDGAQVDHLARIRSNGSLQ